jgi:hypothetical protein
MSGEGEVLNKFLHVAAVLALLAGTSALAQVGGSVGGQVGGMISGSVDGQIDRSVNTGVGGNGNGGGGGGGKTQSHASAASWAPTRSAAEAEKSEKMGGEMGRAGAHEGASSGKAEMNKEAPKAGALKKFGASAGSAETTKSSFSMASKSDMPQFGFNGKMQLVGSSHSSEHEKTHAAKFGRAVAGHQGRAGGRHKQGRGAAFMPKLRSPVGGGESNCANASSLQLCTGF